MTEQLDQLAGRLERKWGIDRLPRLVSPATQLRFNQAVAMCETELGAFTSPDRRAALDAMMGRAWAALDAEAEKLGHAPMPAAWVETEWLPGRVFAIALDDQHRQALILRDKAEGRDVSVFTVAEIGDLIRSIPDVARVLELFPGAQITVPPAQWRSGRSRMAVADDLSDVLPMAGEGVGV